MTEYLRKVLAVCPVVLCTFIPHAVADGRDDTTRSGQRCLNKDKPGHPRFCRTRHDLVSATGLSYRTLINWESIWCSEFDPQFTVSGSQF